MPDIKNTVDDARKMLEQRRSDLQSELQDIEKAISALGGRAARTVRGSTGSRRSGKRTRTTKPAARGKQSAKGTQAKTATQSRRRRRKGGTRSDQAVKLITSKPGQSASEIASELGIKPNYMYRVLSDLEGEGKIRKDGRKYYATS